MVQACSRRTCCQQYWRTQRRRLLKPRQKRDICPPVRPRPVTGTSTDQAARRAPPQDSEDAEEGRLVIEGFSFGTVAARVHPCCTFPHRTRPPKAVTVWNQRCRLPTPHNDDAVRGPIKTPAAKRGWRHLSTKLPPQSPAVAHARWKPHPVQPYLTYTSLSPLVPGLPSPLMASPTLQHCLPRPNACQRS